jgi:ribose 5-phosphate isomerase A
MLSAVEIKKTLGKYATQLVPAHGTIGLGTGTTVEWLIREMGAMVKNGLDIKAVPTSSATTKLALEAGIKIIGLNDIDIIELTIDGADEIDPQFQLIKGGGGALLQEKMVAAASKKVVIIADESKYVDRLGRFPLPVEVIPNGWRQIQKKIMAAGCPKAELRLINNLPCITDNGNYIIDCHYGMIEDASALNIELHLLPGVVETGLFIGMATEVIIGHADGKIELKKYIA